MNKEIKDYSFEKIFNNLKKLDNLLGKYNIKSVDELDKKLADIDIWKKACELASREAPQHCPNPPEYYDAQDEYGCDEPYYIQESACEICDYSSECLRCQIDYFYKKAQKLIKNENKINIDKYKFNKEDFIKDFDNNDIKKFENLICKTIGIDNDENKGE